MFGNSMAQPANPYQATSNLNDPNFPQPTRQGSGYPVFALVMFIIAIIFCVLRTFLALASTFGATVLPADHPLGWTVYLEVATSWTIALFGLLGYGMMLARKDSGIPLAWLSIAGVVGSLVCGLIQTPILLKEQGLSGDALSAAWGGAIVVSIIRVGILLTVAAAIVVYTKWRKASRDPENGYGAHTHAV